MKWKPWWLILGLAAGLAIGSVAGHRISKPPIVQTFNEVQDCKDKQIKVKTNLEDRLDSEKKDNSSEAEKFAVLTASTIDERDMFDLALSYQILIEQGYKRENIYVLDGDGSYTPIYPVDDYISKENLRKIFENLSERMDEKDQLLVLLDGHGSKETYAPEWLQDFEILELSTYSLPGEDNLTELELKEMLDPIKAKTKIVIADICYGGGFAERFCDENYVGISNGGILEKSHGNSYDTFTRHLMESHRLIGSDSYDVSIQDAFDYAEMQHPWTRKMEDTAILCTQLDADDIYI